MPPSLHAHHWIDGEWVDSETVSDSVDPATGETIGTYTEAGEAEATKAVVAARRGFRKTEWRGNRRLRAKALNEMADRFEARIEDLVSILSLENGKVEGEARFEVGMVPSKLRFYAVLALTEFGRAMETSPGRYTMTLREPMGVAGIIAPWNSPIVLFIRSLAPALAAGCTVVGKLPGFTAQTNARMCEVFAEVTSLPKGVLNVLSEVHRGAADTIVDSPDVPTISLTGSSKTGQQIMASGAKNMKRFGGELGGKTPVLLFDDADLDKALPRVEKALTTFAGQFCMTGSRLLVHRPILDEVRERLRSRLEAVKAGPASDPSSDMGPMINIANVDRVVFGPVLVMQAFDTEEEAIALANNSDYGLAASIWSTNVDRPPRIARRIEAGTLWINNWAVVYDETEEGGYKQSGLGRLNGDSAMDDFVEYRTIIHEIELGAGAGNSTR